MGCVSTAATHWSIRPAYLYQSLLAEHLTETNKQKFRVAVVDTIALGLVRCAARCRLPAWDISIPA